MVFNLLNMKNKLFDLKLDELSSNENHKYFTYHNKNFNFISHINYEYTKYDYEHIKHIRRFIKPNICGIALNIIKYEK